MTEKKEREALFKAKVEKDEERRHKAFATYKKDRIDYENELRTKQQELKEKDEKVKLEIK